MAMETTKPEQTALNTHICADQVNVKIAHRTLLNQVSFNFDHPGIIGVLGKNGSGKSTLLRALANLTPYTGTIKINHLDTTQMSRPDKAKIMSWVPQDFHIPFGFTSLDIVNMGRFAHHHGHPTKEDQNIALSALDSLEIPHLAHRPVTKLSQGELQKVNIARAIATDSQILLLDEPSSNLDIASTINLFRLLVEERTRGKIIFVALHDMQLAASYCDHILGIQDGSCMINSPTATTNWQDVFRELFQVKVLSQKIADQWAFVVEHIEDS